jgi:hypothetical protein
MHNNFSMQYFSTKFSNILPEERMPISMFYATAERSSPAIMTRRKPDNLARITRGWIKFVREYGLQDGDVFVFTFNYIGNHLVIRILRAMQV